MVDQDRERTRIVSPINTGFGNVVLSTPWLPSVVPRIVSPTEGPTTRPRVKTLLTRIRPWMVPLANSASRCSAIPRQRREQQVVRLGDRAPRLVRELASDLEFFEVPSGHRTLPLAAMLTLPHGL